jgi:TolB-like protein
MTRRFSTPLQSTSHTCLLLCLLMLRTASVYGQPAPSRDLKNLDALAKDIGVMTSGRTLAVIPFRDLSTPNVNTKQSEVLADDLVTKLINVHGLRLVTRDNEDLAKILAVAKFEDSGLVDQNSVRALTLLGVDVLVVGSFRRTSQDLTINCRLIELATSLFLAGWTVTIPRESRWFSVWVPIIAVPCALVGVSAFVAKAQKSGADEHYDSYRRATNVDEAVRERSATESADEKYKTALQYVRYTGGGCLAASILRVVGRDRFWRMRTTAQTRDAALEFSGDYATHAVLAVVRLSF